MMGHGSMRASANGKGNIKNLIKALAPYKINILISLLFIAFSTVLSVYAPQVFSKFTDEIAVPANAVIDLQKVAKLSVILIVFYGSNAVCNYAANFIMVTVTQKYARGIRSNISRKINAVPLGYFDSHQYGDTLSIITNDVDTITQSVDQAVSMFFSSAFMLTGVLIAMFVTAWQMALTVLLIVPLMLILIMIITKIALPQFQKNQQYLAELNGTVEENYTGHSVIQAFNAGERTTAHFEKQNSRLRASVFKAQAVAGLMMPAMTFISYFAYAAVCVVGGLLMNGGAGVTFGTISAFLLYINLFQSPMSQMAQAMNSLQMAAAAAGRIYGFTEQEELSDETGKQRKLLSDDGKGEIRGEVEFKNVRFGYTPDKIIISDFSAKILPGMKVAIVGPTGAGKTTLVNLLMRFYELDGGDITID